MLRNTLVETNLIVPINYLLLLKSPSLKYTELNQTVSETVFFHVMSHYKYFLVIFLFLPGLCQPQSVNPLH